MPSFVVTFSQRSACRVFISKNGLVVNMAGIPYTLPMIRTRVLQIPVDALTKNEALERLAHFLNQDAQQSTPVTRRIFSINPEIVLRAQKDSNFKIILETGDLLLPDGQGIVWALRRRGVASERMTGADLFFHALNQLNEKRGSLFVVLSKNGLSTEADVRLALSKKYPNILWDDTTPDAVFVSLGAPHQEQWIAEHTKEYPSARVFMTIGGAIDFLTGRLRRSPPVFHRLGLEWLWRLVQQPQRLPRILRAVIVFPFYVVFGDRQK